MYQIEIAPGAEQDLRWFKRSSRNVILDGIEANLRYEPNVETRNRFRLRPNQTVEWELRVRDYRVFYDVDARVGIVSIVAVGLKVGNRLFFQGKEREL